MNPKLLNDLAKQLTDIAITVSAIASEISGDVPEAFKANTPTPTPEAKPEVKAEPALEVMDADEFRTLILKAGELDQDAARKVFETFGYKSARFVPAERRADVAAELTKIVGAA